MKVFTEVTVGGPLSNNKGINKLGGGLSAEALTEKDKADIVTAAQIGVDYLAVSFPRCGEDLNYAPSPGARCRLRRQNRRESRARGSRLRPETQWTTLFLHQTW
ncbi:pyruvate kinase [Citrobacter koseri]|uniref:Pyruvate kinase n=1 Tax=Citrobacter koseri TaxID=545 RepID=A0A447UGS3_CITKO|nr:pyruvate kinase [Citrobacter koseri]